jgi:exodeoxyribonuclease VII small subunit
MTITTNHQKLINMATETKYEDAIRQLEDIVEKMENNEMGIDEMTAQLKKAQQLIKLCKDRLTKTDAEIKQILGDK